MASDESISIEGVHKTEDKATFVVAGPFEEEARVSIEEGVHEPLGEVLGESVVAEIFPGSLVLFVSWCVHPWPEGDAVELHVHRFLFLFALAIPVLVNEGLSVCCVYEIRKSSFDVAAPDATWPDFLSYGFDNALA